MSYAEGEGRSYGTKTKINHYRRQRGMEIFQEKCQNDRTERFAGPGGVYDMPPIQRTRLTQ